MLTGKPEYETHLKLTSSTLSPFLGHDAVAEVEILLQVSSHVSINFPVGHVHVLEQKLANVLTSGPWWVLNFDKGWT